MIKENPFNFKNTKIIFFDIDGTLIDPSTKKMSPKTKYTLQQLKAKGIKICIATGRSPMVVPKYKDIEFDAYLTYNGSYCYCGKDIIYSNPIPTKDIKQILSNAAKLNRPLTLATNQRLASNGKDQDLIDYYAFANLEIEIADDFDEVLNENVYQIMMGCRIQDHPQILENTTHSKIVYWWDRAVDIIPKSGGKEIGIHKTLDYFHMNTNEAMAFGDGHNDIEMLECVGFGVAMGNSSLDVQNKADDICQSVNEDGIYEYCLKHGLIEYKIKG